MINNGRSGGHSFFFLNLISSLALVWVVSVASRLAGRQIIQGQFFDQWLEMNGDGAVNTAPLLLKERHLLQR